MDKKNAEQLVNVLRRMMFAAYRSGVIQKIDEERLSYFQRNILLFISEHDGCKMKDVSVYLSISPPAMTKMVEKLVQKKFIKRLTLAKERRAQFLYATPKGFDLIKQYKARQVNVTRQLIDLVADKKACDCILPGITALTEAMEGVKKAFE